jgi:hypothetical protein
MYSWMYNFSFLLMQPSGPGVATMHSFVRDSHAHEMSPI